MKPLKELKKELLGEFGRLISSTGFSPKPDGQAFYRPEGFGRSAVHLGFITHGQTDFEVTIDFGLRFDAVEELVNAESPFLSAKEKALTATLGVELGNLVSGEPRRWTVPDESSVTSAAAEMADAFREIGLPYLQRFSDAQEVFELLSRNDREAWLHCPVHGVRASKALAFAHLLQKDDPVIDGLITSSTAFLTSMEDFGLERFQEFARKLQAARHVLEGPAGASCDCPRCRTL